MHNPTAGGVLFSRRCLRFSAVGGAIAAPYLGCPSSESEVLAGTGTGYWSLRVHCRSPLASP
ncbi:hypothetical protein PtB15_6B542 [Puccinia triticina]|nr:hypothetical protein PtB15_6B542 [Puccinia triticina]